MEERHIRKANKLLQDELGTSPTGMPFYEWKHSDKWIRLKRVVSVSEDGTITKHFHHVTDPVTGLIKTIPLYAKAKVCAVLHNQWVMSRWMPAGEFAEWRQLYGDDLEWPKGGEYWPVNAVKGNPLEENLVCLNQGQEPTESDSWRFIRVVRGDRIKGVEQYEAEMEAIRLSKRNSIKDQIAGEIANKLPAYWGFANRSTPVWPGVGHNMDKRVTAEERKIILGRE